MLVTDIGYYVGVNFEILMPYLTVCEMKIGFSNDQTYDQIKIPPSVYQNCHQQDDVAKISQDSYECF